MSTEYTSAYASEPRALPSVATFQAPAVLAAGTEAVSAAAVRFDRPLLDHPGWGDPRMARQVDEAARLAREQALAAGYAAGWAQGRKAFAERQRRDAVENAKREQETRRQFTARAQSLLAAIAAASRTLTDEAVPAWEQLTQVLLDGAMAIASACLDRELNTVDGPLVETVRTALRLLPQAENVTVHLNPDDVQFLELGSAAMPEGLTLVPDPSVTTGTVLARTPLQSLPLDLRAGLRAAEEVLRG